MDPGSDLPNLLIIEDDADTASLIVDTLTVHFKRPCICKAGTIQAALACDIHAIHLVLCDYNLPDGTGLDALRRLLALRPDLPVVMVTGQNEISTALEALRLGAYDYVVKAGEFLSIIPLTVEKNLARWRIKQENARLQRELETSLRQLQESHEQLSAMVAALEEMALTDALTGLSNRRRLNDALPRMFAEAQRYGTDLSCVMIDLDGFKALNDTLGHQRGDEVLRLAGRIVRANCRAADLAARYGGDEFVVVLPQTDCQTASVLAQRILREFDEASPALSAGAVKPVSMSAGIACSRTCRPTNGEQLLKIADQTLYAAKAAGKARIMLAGDPNAAPTAAVHVAASAP